MKPFYNEATGKLELPPQMTQMPGLTVLNAATCDELQAMIRYALTLDAPVAIRYGKTETENVAVWPREKPYAPMWPLLRTGDELAILACGAMVGQAMRAAELLDQQSLRCAVYAADCIQPLDENVLNQLKDSKLVTLEEGVVSGGLSSLVPAWRVQAAADAGRRGLVRHAGRSYITAARAGAGRGERGAPHCTME